MARGALAGDESGPQPSSHPPRSLRRAPSSPIHRVSPAKAGAHPDMPPRTLNAESAPSYVQASATGQWDGIANNRPRGNKAALRQTRPLALAQSTSLGRKTVSAFATLVARQASRFHISFWVPQEHPACLQTRGIWQDLTALICCPAQPLDSQKAGPGSLRSPVEPSAPSGRLNAVNASDLPCPRTPSRQMPSAFWL